MDCEQPVREPELSEMTPVPEEPVALAPYCFEATPLTAVRGLGSPELLRSKRRVGVLFVKVIRVELSLATVLPFASMREPDTFV